MYVDGDDLIDPRTVELMVEAADNYRVPLVVGSFAKTPLLDSYKMGQDAEFVVTDHWLLLAKVALRDRAERAAQAGVKKPRGRKVKESA